MAVDYIYDGMLLTNEDGNLVQIKYDVDPQSPREWDNGTHFYMWDGNSPDTDVLWCGGGMGRRAPEMWELLEDHLDSDTLEELDELGCAQHLKGWDKEWMLDLMQWSNDTDYVPQLTKYLNELDGVWCRPVSKSCYDNSYYIGNPGEGGEGVIIMTEEGREEMDTPVERVMSLLKDDVEIYSKYATGDVYGFIVYDHNGNETDSCWGFYGIDDEDVIAAIEDHTGKLSECKYDSVLDYVKENRTYSREYTFDGDRINDAVEPIIGRKLTNDELERVIARLIEHVETVASARLEEVVLEIAA